MTLSYFQWKKQWSSIALVTLLGGSFALLFSLLTPLEYSSSVRFLILQKNQASLDPYTALKSSEQIGDTLSQVMYTSTFFDRILHVDPTIKTSLFSHSERKKRKIWKRMISTQTGRGSGFLTLTVYHRDRLEARKIIQAMMHILVNEGWQYVNSDIVVRVVDAPLDSRFPVRPNIPLNVFTGCMLAFTGGILFIGVHHHRRAA